MTVIAAVEAGRRPAPRWPALVAAWYVAVVCVGFGNLVVWHLLNEKTLADVGVILLALGLRLLTIVLAVASVAGWGRFVPGWLLLAGLWGAAAVQLSYPLAETVGKALVLTGAIEPIGNGISTMGWFTFAGTWLVWGVPGALFLLAARAYGRRVAVARRWVLLGVLGGLGLLLGLGLLIG